MRDAFTAKGHDATSCDLLDCETPGQHIKGDVITHLADGWDMMIAHPPCQYLTRAAARYWNTPGRPARQLAAVEFVRQLWQAPIPRIAIENPPGCLTRELGPFQQTIQPWHFGAPWTKLTCLWLKGLPPLMSTFHEHHHSSWTEKQQAQSKSRWKNRSRTFPEIAAAMANQWG